MPPDQRKVSFDEWMLFALYAAATIVLRDDATREAWKKDVASRQDDPDQAIKDLEEAVESFRPTAAHILHGHDQ